MGYYCYKSRGSHTCVLGRLFLKHKNKNGDKICLLTLCRHCGVALYRYITAEWLLPCGLMGSLRDCIVQSEGSSEEQ